MNCKGKKEGSVSPPWVLKGPCIYLARPAARVFECKCRPGTSSGCGSNPPHLGE